MSRLSRLQSAKTLSDLAAILGFTPKNLAYIAYHIPDSAKYSSFKIPKKNGEDREILAPNEKLKEAQNRLSILLYDCIDESDIKSDRRPLSHGFERGQSIKSNAQIHTNQRYVFNIDLKDFFPSINFGRVRGYFIKNNTFKLHPKVASIIAQLACFNNKLPQGSPCSPVISNLISQSLDFYLVQLAKKHRCTYSRYADDITFSSKSKSFPKEIAYEKSKLVNALIKIIFRKERRHIWHVGSELNDQIIKSGFTINPKKTRMQYKDSRQLTTGLIVNRKVNIRSEYYKTVRSQCHELFNKGSFYQIKGISEESGETVTEPGTLSELQGKLNFIYEIKNPNQSRRKVKNDKNGKPRDKKWAKEQGVQYERKEQRKSGDIHKPRGISALYQRFLHFKYLYSLDKPLVICEGKTDYIYLRCALNQLSPVFPNLAKKVTYRERGKDKERTELSFNFLNNHGRILEIWRYGMGASFLAKLIKDYGSIFSYFKCGGLKHPVIIIVDNDDGPRGKNGIYKNIEIYTHKEIDGTKAYYHVTKNLYVIPLPKPNSGNDIEFEDLFFKKTLQIPNRGKIFAKKITDKTKEFGKDRFANYVVRQNQKDINFRKFRPLLRVLETVIEDYKKRSPIA